MGKWVSGCEGGTGEIDGTEARCTSLCTLIAIHRRIEGAPLVVAANRDEYHERPATGPALRGFGIGDVACPIIAPLDVRAGGTWLGLNAFGVFAAVTNLRCEGPDPARRSRGMVVVDALRAPSAERAADALKALPTATYNPFHCYVADEERAFLLSYRDEPRVRELEPGVHVVGNRDPEEEPLENLAKIHRVRAAAENAATAGASEVLEQLASICREHETGGGGIGDTCVHLGDYGTRSSALLKLGNGHAADRHARSELRFASEAPCKAPYEDFSILLREQRQMAERSGEIVVRKAS